MVPLFLTECYVMKFGRFGGSQIALAFSHVDVSIYKESTHLKYGMDNPIAREFENPVKIRVRNHSETE